jgi:hypothetical protein
VKVHSDNRLIKGLDLALDFATLGEYRLVTPLRRPPAADQRLWTGDLSWVQRPRAREVTCSLPRAHQRRLARRPIGR